MPSKSVLVRRSSQVKRQERRWGVFDQKERRGGSASGSDPKRVKGGRSKISQKEDINI